MTPNDNPTNSDLLALASRNAMIRRWLQELRERDDFTGRALFGVVSRDYAGFLNIPDAPFDEVALEDATDRASLEYLWVRWEDHIRISESLRFNSPDSTL